ncbi:MAG: hypothetical protein ABDH37_07420 [Candidatus Hydrothermales bacterium]
MKVGIFLIILGLFIWFLNLGIFSFWNWKRDWPWILIIIGIFSILGYFKRKIKRLGKFKKERIKDVIDKLERGEINIEEAIERIKEVE